jgi:ABC-type multidrug transport system ATPase subunit/pSer/pThr/pTyr-binding forkhead associated (FHA) protein
MTAPPAKLKIETKGQPPVNFALERVQISMGKADDNTLVFDDVEVSRHHATLSWQQGCFYIEDLGSATGTTVNGIKLLPRTPEPLQDHDQIRMGGFLLSFSISGLDPESDSEEVQSIPDLPGTVVLGGIGTPILLITTKQWMQEFPLKQDVIVLGRDPRCDIQIDHPAISHRHALISRGDEGYEITDLGSKQGLFHNYQKVTQQSLKDGDVFKIGNDLTLTFIAVAPPQPTEELAPLNLLGRTSFTFGRDPTNNKVIDHPVVSRFHAKLELVNNQWMIQDLDSSNGTYVDGLPIQGKQVLKPGESIRVGPCQVIFNGDGTLIPLNEAGNLRLDALHLSKEAKKGNRRIILLDDISLSILPREFVAVVGGSGAGKSTLLDALNGFRPATKGMVLVNSHDLYKNFNAYRTEVGYVPQDDIIHQELAVAQALNYAARLRLPPDTSAAERHYQVQSVLRDLELTHRRDVLVKNLSGGQRKRVSIGVELLTKPSLFFLDEATSGLDPGTEVQMMRLLRRLADQGRTILLITHATKNVRLCDLVVFLAKGGKVAYFGPPMQALAYFGVKDFDEIYLKVESELSPEEWQQRYRSSQEYQEYVVQRQLPLGIDTVNGRRGRSPQTAPVATNKGVPGWRQFLILTQRSLTILLQDRGSLVLMLALAPMLGLLDFIMWKRYLFDVTKGDAGQSFTMGFLSVLIPVIVGSLAMMREIVKESEIYRRERMVGLKILPYIFSKVGLGTVLALFQATIFLATKLLAVDLPNYNSVNIFELYITLLLATLGGMIMGLLVSALAPSQNAAPLLTILFLVPQITFAGSILPLKDMGTPGRFISQLTITRWTYESMVTTLGIGKDIAADVCWDYPKAVLDDLGDDGKRGCRCHGENLFSRCHFPGLWQPEDQVAVRQPEPEKPEELVLSFPDPRDPAYAQKLQDYQDATEKFNQDIQDWQTRFGDWKQDRGSAIAGGEALVSRFRDNQGPSFAVNIYQHWARVGAIMVSMLAILLMIQKRKDII